MRLTKGDVCAIELPNKEGYIYFLYLGGNINKGYIVEVFNYKSEKLEDDVQSIINKEPLFKNKYINTYAPYHDSLLKKVGKVKIENSDLEKIYINDRVSMKANSQNFAKVFNLSKDHTLEEYNKALIDYALSKNIHHFDDWKVYKYGFIGQKFEFLEEYKVGILSAKEKEYMLSGTTYSSEDIIMYYKHKIDRIYAKQMILQ